MTLLEHALRYAELGWYVFPIQAGKKKPYSAHGWRDATRNPEKIQAFWEKWPNANIGVWLDGSGCCAVDRDPGAPFLEECYDTLTVNTPRGGEHLIYKGKIPTTAHKLAPHVDTRGVGGYTIFPPSRTDKGVYSWANAVGEPKPSDAEDAPAWLTQQLVVREEREPQPPAVDDIDRADRVERMWEIARGWPIAVEGQGSDGATIALANALLDFCSEEQVEPAMLEWADRCGFDHYWVLGKLANAAYYRTDAIGCDPYQHPEWAPPGKPPRGKFAGRWPHNFVDDPEPTFWDPSTQMIPKVVDEGATVLVYGQYSSHKTNVTLTWIMDMVAAGARVCYAAGEGARGVGKKRIPAHCASRGISVESLEGRLSIVPAIPLLQQPSEVNEFLDAQEEFKPNVVVLDTLATATAGLDENSSIFASLLTDNGAVGQIKRHFKATVLVIAHEGKDVNRGARGHSGLQGNVDASLQVSVTDNTIDVYVAKMRDGEDKFHVEYSFPIGGVPVPKFVRRYTNGEKVKAQSGLRQAVLKIMLERRCRIPVMEMWKTLKNEDNLPFNLGGRTNVYNWPKNRELSDLIDPQAFEFISLSDNG